MVAKYRPTTLKQELEQYLEDEEFTEKFNRLMEIMHIIAQSKGWWNPAKSFGEQVLMMHTELSEVVEEARKSDSNLTRIYYNEQYSVPTSKPEGVPIEFGDVIIRIFDTCTGHDIDLLHAVITKAIYNLQWLYRHGNKSL